MTSQADMTPSTGQIIGRDLSGCCMFPINKDRDRDETWCGGCGRRIGSLTNHIARWASSSQTEAS